MCLLCIFNEVESYNKIVELIISLLMLIITIVGVVGVFNLRKHQKEASYGFYINCLVFLECIKIHLYLSDNQLPQWLKILGLNCSERTLEINKSNYDKALSVSSVTTEFLNFLSKADNQVPPYRLKKNNKKWNESFSVLRKWLIQMTTIKENIVFNEWTEDEFENSLKSLQEAIDYIKNSIDLKII